MFYNKKLGFYSFPESSIEWLKMRKWPVDPGEKTTLNLYGLINSRWTNSENVRCNWLD